MKNATLQQILALGDNENNAAETLFMLKHYNSKYVTTDIGTNAKIRTYYDNRGNEVVEILTAVSYRDIGVMDKNQLQEYYEELEDAYDDVSSEEPEDEQSSQYEEWEEVLTEIEEEMDEVEARLLIVKG